MANNTNLAEVLHNTDAGFHTNKIVSLPRTVAKAQSELIQPGYTEPGNAEAPLPSGSAGNDSSPSNIFDLLPAIAPALFLPLPPNKTEPGTLNWLPVPEKDDLVDKIDEFKSENIDEFLFDDLSNGQLFKTVFSGELLFCKEKNLWLVYNGIRWVEDTKDHVKKLIMELANVIGKHICGQITDKKDPVYKRASGWRSRKTQENVFKTASTLMSVSVSEFDANNNLLNCRNGTIELLEDGYIFREHRPQDLLTKCADVDFLPDEVSPVFENFLVSTMQAKPIGENPEFDAESETRKKVEYLQRMTGYCLSGENKEECFFILHGDGRNGKGVFIHALNKMLGDYATTAMPCTFARGQSARSGAASEDVARLAGSRFISVPEPEKHFPLNEAFIKAITGSDSLQARHLYKSSFEFKMTGKIVMSTNHLPRILDRTVFSTGRIILIPFDRNFAEHEQDKSLKERLISEASKAAVLKWALEGYRMQCIKSVKIFPQSMTDVIEKYEQKTVNARQFIADEMAEAPDGAILCTTSEAYGAYKDWCEDNDFHAESQEAFNMEVKKIAKIQRKDIGQGKKSYIIGRCLKP